MAQKGDFIGFTFNGTHSSDLGIVRTSNGSRYNTSLLPSSSDQTVAVPGGDGVYFFGTNYQTRVFQLQIASDEISEETMRRIQQTWGDKEIHELIFDETPYKVYMAKCTNMPQFNFICFDENNQRVYKGEGSVEFTCYYPYAKSRHKFLKDYMKEYENLTTAPQGWPINWFKKVDNQYIMIQPGTIFTNGTYYKSIPEWYGGEFALGEGIMHNHNLLGEQHIDYPGNLTSLINIDEWAVASGMLEDNQSNTIDVVGTNATEVCVYNPGDIEADFQLWFVPNGATTIRFRHGSQAYDSYHRLELNAFSLVGNDVCVQYDSKTELLTGYISNNTPSSNLYNKYIKAGDFFKIPIIKGDDYTYKVDVTNSATINSIKYDYLYY